MKKLIGTIIAAGVLIVGAGCSMLSDNQKKELDTAIQTAIVKALDERGQKAAEDLVDRLVKDGKLSASTAEAVKKAIPAGIEKLTKTLEEAGK